MGSPPIPPARAGGQKAFSPHLGLSFAVFSLVAVTTAMRIDGGSDESCYRRYVNHYSSLSPVEVRAICHVVGRVAVEESGQQTAASRPTSAAAMTEPGLGGRHAPTEQELRSLVHVEDQEDERKREEDLRRTEEQEEYIRDRDRSELAAQIIQDLGAVISSPFLRGPGQGFADFPFRPSASGGMRSHLASYAPAAASAAGRGGGDILLPHSPLN